MPDDAPRTLRVAAVQIPSTDGDVSGNLSRATPWVEQAKARGAELALLPEFLATGYVFTSEIWHAAESADGPTVEWLRTQAHRLGLWLGASFLEAEGDDFYNTFVLATPDGGEAGRVRKQAPALFEAYFTKGATGPHALRTSFGVVGVGICFENQLAATTQACREDSPDLLLMPHSAPSPARSTWLGAKLATTFEAVLRDTAPWYARTFGIPVVMANKCGPWRTPLPGLPLVRQDSHFPGLSAIVDSDGRVKARGDEREALLVDDVVLDPSRKTNTSPPARGRWARPLPRIVSLCRLPEQAGHVWYSLSRERRRRARAISAARGRGPHGP